MAAQERREFLPSHPVLISRLSGMRQRLFDPGWVRKFRQKTTLLYRKTDKQTEEIMSLSPMTKETRAMLVNQDGVPIVKRWQQTEKISKQYKILGSRPQPGRDYIKNPPQKTLKQLTPMKFRRGIDVMLRGTEEILSQYTFRENGGRERSQIQAILARAMDLQRKMSHFRESSDEQVKKIVEENFHFLEANHLMNPKDPNKRRIRDMMLRGFIDSRGRKNYLAAFARLYSILLATMRRQEGAFPATISKYSQIVELTRFKRESVRNFMQMSNGILEEILTERIFTTPSIGSEPRDVWIQDARATWIDLRDISYGLLNNVDVFPYSAGARWTILLFGTVKVENLPKGSVIKKVYENHQHKDTPTVTYYLKRGEFDNARKLIETAKDTMQGILDRYADYKTVKKEED